MRTEWSRDQRGILGTRLEVRQLARNRPHREAASGAVGDLRGTIVGVPGTVIRAGHRWLLGCQYSDDRRDDEKCSERQPFVVDLAQ